jgi:hypothetical protein
MVSSIVFVALSIVLLSSPTGTQSPRIHFTEPQMGDCSMFGFEFRIMTLNDKEIGCVASYDELGNNFAAILSCVLEPDRESDHSNAVSACTSDWQILNLETAEHKTLEAPDFNHYFSSPSFQREYVAYWGFAPNPQEGSGALLYTIVFDWKHQRLLERKLVGSERLETDNPYHFRPPEWIEEDSGTRAEFDFLGKRLSIELSK